MKITVSTTREELEEMKMDIHDLKEAIIEDLDSQRSYSGFTVEIFTD